jgi:cytochrome c-type biogenesis protein CcmE
MKMTRKRRRIMLIAIGGLFMVSAAAMVGVGMRDTIVFFFSPTELAERQPGPDERLRVGGLVVEGSVVRDDGGTVTFEVTDGGATQAVAFSGVLPDLFREGQGVIAQGRLRDGVFVADEVLAKHDEKYMPREVADALKKQGVYRGDGSEAGG